MSIDWTSVAQTGVTVLGVVLPVVTTVGAAWLRANGQAMAAQAIVTAGGVAYDALHNATKGGTVDWATARATAIQEGVAAVQAITGDPATEAVLAKVTGAFGNALAADPTVTVTGNSVATAVAAPGQDAYASADGGKTEPPIAKNLG